MNDEGPMCPACGLPMSFAEPETGPDEYLCDGPNDRTSQTGCGEAIDAEEVDE